MASVNDKITDTRNAARPNSARVSAPRSVGGATLTCDSLSGWPTDSKVHFSTYQIDSNLEVVTGTQVDWYGIVSGNTVGSLTLVDGTDSGNSVGDVVEMLPTAGWGQDLADGLMVSHNRDGSLKDGAVDSADVLAADVVTTAKILDSNVTTAKIADNAVTAAKVDGLDKSLLSTDSNPYKFHAYQASDQAIVQNTLSTPNLGAEVFDTNSNLSGAVYTAPVTGFYYFSGRTSVVGVPGYASGIGAYLYLNSTHVDGIYVYDNNVSFDIVTATCQILIQMTAGDTMTLKTVYVSNNGTNGTLNAGRPYNNFSGFLVSRT